MPEHSHLRGYPRNQTPTVKTISVVEVTFLRGEGCCDEDPVRTCTAYWRTDTGQLLTIKDPVDSGRQGSAKLDQTRTDPGRTTPV